MLRPYLDIFYTAYINNILIYSKNLEDYKKHIQTVLLAYKKAGLQLDINKYEFY